MYICETDDIYFVDSIAKLMRDSIKHHEKDTNQPWYELRLEGVRCVKVLVTIEEIK